MKPKAKTSTERSTKFRVKVYEDEQLHKEFKLKDSLRKRITRSVQQPLTEAEQLLKRKNAKERQQRSRLSRKSKKKTPSEMVKSALQKQRRKLVASALSTPLTTPPPSSSSSSPSRISNVMWEHMTPTSRRKLKASLQKSSKAAGEKVNSAFRRELGINLSNPVLVDTNESDLKQKVKLFFENDNVACTNPDTKKITNGTPQRLALSSYSCLHDRFVAAHDDCSYRQFVRYVPEHVRQPKSASDWGTCLCAYCLNPTMKLEALMNKGIMEKFNVEELVTGTDGEFKQMLQKLTAVGEEHSKTPILYHKWSRVPNPLSKKGTMISRKVPVINNAGQISKELLKELTVMRQHLERSHQQYSAFKAAREQAASNPSTVTINIDWSENKRIRQAREEKSAYYNETQISIHCMYIWSGEETQSVACISECTNHKAAASFATLEMVIGEKSRSILHLMSNNFHIHCHIWNSRIDFR